MRRDWHVSRDAGHVSDTAARDLAGGAGAGAVRPPFRSGGHKARLVISGSSWSGGAAEAGAAMATPVARWALVLCLAAAGAGSVSRPHATVALGADYGIMPVRNEL